MMCHRRRRRRRRRRKTHTHTQKKRYRKPAHSSTLPHGLLILYVVLFWPSPGSNWGSPALYGLSIYLKCQHVSTCQHTLNPKMWFFKNLDRTHSSSQHTKWFDDEKVILVSQKKKGKKRDEKKALERHVDFIIREWSFFCCWCCFPRKRKFVPFGGVEE